MISTHWNYRGLYRFLSNNCSHETLALLKRSMPDNGELRRVLAIKPSTLESELVRMTADLSSAVGPRDSIAFRPVIDLRHFSQL